MFLIKFLFFDLNLAKVTYFAAVRFLLSFVGLYILNNLKMNIYIYIYIYIYAN